MEKTLEKVIELPLFDAFCKSGGRLALVFKLPKEQATEDRVIAIREMVTNAFGRELKEGRVGHDGDDFIRNIITVYAEIHFPFEITGGRTRISNVLVKLNRHVDYITKELKEYNPIHTILSTKVSEQDNTQYVYFVSRVQNLPLSPLVQQQTKQ